MSDSVIHKIIMPIPTSKEGRPIYLNDLILCWIDGPSTSTGSYKNIRVSTNINDVNCVMCWDMWVA